MKEGRKGDTDNNTGIRRRKGDNGMKRGRKERQRIKGEIEK